MKRPNSLTVMALAGLMGLGLPAMVDAKDGRKKGQRKANHALFAMKAKHRGVDRNGDGLITRSEWRGSARSFRQLDHNGDGFLSGRETTPGKWTSGKGRVKGGFRK
jgi:hypothetical protein